MSCCDTIRSAYDILLESGKLDFLYILDVLHCDSACSRERMAVQLKRAGEGLCTVQRHRV